MVKLIDTHCHIYSSKFENDRDAAIENSKLQGVELILMPNVDIESVEGMYAAENRYTGYCMSMMGLHPCSVNENFESALDALEKEWDNRDFIAVGEIGLDLYWDKTTLSMQQTALRRQLEFAIARNKPVVLHTRSAVKETVEIIREFAGRGLSGVFHCFSEGYEYIDEIAEMGFYFGIGGVLTYKNSGLAEAVLRIPESRLVLETDAPYLAPVPFRGKRNEPAYIWQVAKTLAEIKGLNIDAIGELTSANAQRLFGF